MRTMKLQHIRFGGYTPEALAQLFDALCRDPKLLNAVVLRILDHTIRVISDSNWADWGKKNRFNVLSIVVGSTRVRLTAAENVYHSPRLFVNTTFKRFEFI